MTKIEKAQIIVWALYNMDDIPSKNNKLVKKYARYSLDSLNDLYKKGIKVLEVHILIDK